MRSYTWTSKLGLGIAVTIGFCLFGNLLYSTKAGIQENPPPSSNSWSDITTGAAMGYCLAKHPYQSFDPGTPYQGGRYTRDGYEMVSTPGIVGAVRRNFIFDRATLIEDEGQKNNRSCKEACAEFCKQYGPAYKGAPLRQRVNGKPDPLNSGIGDMASLAMPDRDFYLNQRVFAGIWSRANTFHESDVAQADLCCCQCVNK